MAESLARDLIARCEAARRNRRQLQGPSLSQAAGPFLVWKAKQPDASERTLKTHERNLDSVPTRVGVNRTTSFLRFRLAAFI
jgi:hypothetical protein